MEIYKFKLRQIENCCQYTAHFNLNTDKFDVLSLVLTLKRAVRDNKAWHKLLQASSLTKTAGDANLHYWQLEVVINFYFGAIP